MRKRNLDLNRRETNSYHFAKQTADASPLELEVIPETRTAIYLLRGHFLVFSACNVVPNSILTFLSSIIFTHMFVNKEKHTFTRGPNDSSMTLRRRVFFWEQKDASR